MDAARLLAVAEEAVLGGGWAGAGLLGLIVGWLVLKHLPTLLEANRVELERSRQAFERALERIVAHCENENRRIGERMDALAGKVEALTDTLARRKP